MLKALDQPVESNHAAVVDHGAPCLLLQRAQATLDPVHAPLKLARAGTRGFLDARFAEGRARHQAASGAASGAGFSTPSKASSASISC